MLKPLWRANGPARLIYVFDQHFQVLYKCEEQTEKTVPLENSDFRRRTISLDTPPRDRRKPLPSSKKRE